MSHIWTFSPSSESQLQKCIAAALPPDENNKWVRAFVRKIDENDSKHNLSVKRHEETKDIEQEVRSDSQEDYKEFVETIENECTVRFDSLVEECCKNHSLFVYLANQLSTPSIEKICKQVYMKAKSDEFLINFYTIFIPTTIKREYCRYIVDFLVQSRENNNKYLQLLLDILIGDSTIPRNVLNEYILTLNEKEQVEFMKYMLNKEINAESFANNIPIVYSIYKKSSISNDIQNIMSKTLLRYGEHCKHDRQYGKLLLAFLQTEQSTSGRLNENIIREIVERHRSAFSRPCETILNKIIERNMVCD